MKKIALSDLKFADYNPRIINKKAFKGLLGSIDEFGDLSGIIWNEQSGNLVCGHQRLRALMDMGCKKVFQDQNGNYLINKKKEKYYVRIVNWNRKKELAANVTANNPEISGMAEISNRKQILIDFTKTLKRLNDKIGSNKGMTKIDLWIIKEMNRLNVIARGETDPGAWVANENIRINIGVIKQQMTQYRKEGFPETEGQAVDNNKVIKWLRQKWIQYRDGGKDDMGGENSPALERYRLARARQEEINLAEREGRIVNIKETIKPIYEMLTIFWNQIVRLRDKLPPILYGKTSGQIRTILKNEIDRAGIEIQKKIDKMKCE